MLAVICVLLAALSGHAAEIETTSAASVSSIKYGMGLGLETRLERDVNPEFSSVRAAGQIFQEIRFQPWTLAVELGYARKDSGSGGFKIASSTLTTGVWGRYDFVLPGRWTPFASTGIGAHFDEVRSSYAEHTDRRRGLRKFWGLGAGIHNVYWKYLLVEAEARASLVEDRKDPALALILRAGVIL